MKTHKILNFPHQNLNLQKSFANELKVSQILAQVLINRGINNISDAEKFLNVKLSDMHDPELFSGMHKAREIIRNAVKNKEKVIVCGDYDVDGLTSLALVKSTLSRMGIEVEHHLPHRIQDGYGIHRQILNIAKEKKIKVLVSVDCGISNHKEIKELRDEGIEVIVTDHHEPADKELPLASSIINPKVKNSHYPCRDLAGVGVAYKFCQGISGKSLLEDLDIVCVGTIADVVPLKGENRIIAKEGLLRLKKTTKPGLRALIEGARIKEENISSTAVGYMIGPRINASGRVSSAETSLKLLMSEDLAEAKKLAQELEVFNRQRQKIEGDILDEAKDLINQQVNFKEHNVIVVAKEGWHQGVLGVVASKLSDKFYRPTIVISMSELLCKGSGRSIANFHLFDALCDSRELLHNFGGHSHAAGLVIHRNRIDEFRQSINRFAKERLRIEDLIPSLDVDMELSLSELGFDLAKELERLSPFGADNPEPIFYTRNLKLKGEPQVLARDTLKFWVSDGTNTYTVVAFRMADYKESLIQAECLDLIYSLKIDTWRGDNSLVLYAEELILK